MAVAIVVTPASGAITARKDFVRIDVTGADPNIRARLKATKTGSDTLTSHNFNPSSDGKHSWFNLMFPDPGAWTLTLYRDDTQASLGTQAVTVI